MSKSTKVCGVDKVKCDLEGLGKTVWCEATHDAESAGEAVCVSAWSDWVRSDAQCEPAGVTPATR